MYSVLLVFPQRSLICPLSVIDAKDTAVSPAETNLHPSETRQPTCRDWIKTVWSFHWNIIIITAVSQSDTWGIERDELMCASVIQHLDQSQDSVMLY